MIVNHLGETHYADILERTLFPFMEDVPLNVQHDSVHTCFPHQGHNRFIKHFSDTWFRLSVLHILLISTDLIFSYGGGGLASE
jgi:hypothetical protein